MDCIKIPIVYRSAGRYENTGTNLVFVPPKQKRMTLVLPGPIYVDEEGVDDPQQTQPAPMNDTMPLHGVNTDSSTDAILRGPRFNHEDRAKRNNQNPTKKNAMATKKPKKRHLDDEASTSEVKKIKTKGGEAADTATHVAASDVCTELKLGLFGR